MPGIDVQRLVVEGTCDRPIGALHIKKALRKGAKLIVVDPRRIDMARRADVHLQLLPGTNVAVLNGLMNIILQ